MADAPLTLRDLNRATLARQMLLERAALPVPAAIERLVGLQAQQAMPPFVGLWTRLEGFERDDLAGPITARSVVKVTLMRATLHLVTAEDYLALRGSIQPALDKAFSSVKVVRDHSADIDFERLIEAARAFIAEAPRTFADISAMLTELHPDAEIGPMRYAVRTTLPLVQVPVDKTWCYPGNPQWTLADDWLGQPVPKAIDVPLLVRRYLAAFGPATVADFQTWSGLPGAKEAIDAMKPELRMLRDERRRELLDLPDQPLPGGDAPAPPRFLPEFDNLLLAHKDRTRVVADEHRKRVYLPALRVAATILVVGVVGGVWRVEKSKGAASLVIAPFAPLNKADRDALADEGERLVRFIDPGAKTYDVRFEA
ncbi:winged helix DNA-binding domain-containing protein [Aggregatilinea lenta]|uniref:winged helix DNA-binding domain-containing protein n=1 Tax=Aggregatilinea lenta TaxID=913108 RepID=UPI000E5A171E|nr:winged helix DNA-binding domain-containing protein [Aggregatilinea lenta]